MGDLRERFIGQRFCRDDLQRTPQRVVNFPSHHALRLAIHKTAHLPGHGRRFKIGRIHRVGEGHPKEGEGGSAGHLPLARQRQHPNRSPFQVGGTHFRQPPRTRPLPLVPCPVTNLRPTMPKGRHGSDAQNAVRPIQQRVHPFSDDATIFVPSPRPLPFRPERFSRRLHEQTVGRLKAHGNRHRLPSPRSSLRKSQDARELVGVGRFRQALPHLFGRKERDDEIATRKPNEGATGKGTQLAQRLRQRRPFQPHRHRPLPRFADRHKLNTRLLTQ
jgi:hypothetical protein